jgi:hypothetical protein
MACLASRHTPVTSLQQAYHTLLATADTWAQTMPEIYDPDQLSSANLRRLDASYQATVRTTNAAMEQLDMYSLEQRALAFGNADVDTEALTARLHRTEMALEFELNELPISVEGSDAETREQHVGTIRTERRKLRRKLAQKDCCQDTSIRLELLGSIVELLERDIERREDWLFRCNIEIQEIRDTRREMRERGNSNPSGSL